MALGSLDAILRRLNTDPASGGGLAGLSYGGGDGSAPGGNGLNPNYTPTSLPGVSSTPPQPQGFSSLDNAAFDQQYQGSYDALQRRLADASSQFDQSNQNDQLDYNRAINDTNQQQELDAAALTDKLANQGILRSGVNVMAQGKLANSYQNRLADFARQNAQALANRQSTYTGFQRDIQDQIASLQGEKATREAAKQDAIARMLAEKQAQDAEMLQRSQPQVTPQGTYQSGMGFGGAPRTIVAGQSNYGIPEGPTFRPSPLGLGKGIQPGAQQAGVIPGFEQLPPEVQTYLRFLASQGS